VTARQQHKGIVVKYYNKKMSVNLPLSFKHLKINIELTEDNMKQFSLTLSSL
jgi:hypothetical protein